MAKHKISSLIGLCFLVWLICIPAAEAVEHLSIDPVRDSLALPCRFDVITSKVFWNAERTEETTGYYEAVEWRVGGKMGAYGAGNNWIMSDTISCVVLYDDIESEGAIRHINKKTLGFSGIYVHDVDNDSIRELLLNYTYNDTVWFSVDDISGADSGTCFVTTGEDLNGSGNWDGCGWIVGFHDVNGDSIVELFIAIDTSYDLYPRAIYCMDWRTGEILWTLPLSSIVPHTSFRVVERPDGEHVLVFEVGSKGNSAVAGDMTDHRSYIVCASLDGEMLWKITTGEIFTSACLNYIDVDGDGYLEIVTQYTPEIEITNRDKDRDYDPVRQIAIVNIDGEIINRHDLARGHTIACTKVADMKDGRGSQIILTFNEPLIQTYDSVLNLTRNIATYARFSIHGIHNFNGDKTKEFYAESDDSKMWILDADFEPLAQMSATEPFVDHTFYPLNSDDGRYGIITGVEYGHEFRRMSISALPWNFIFYRKPWLAFLAAFVPMLMIVSFSVFHITRMRSKNRMISKAHDDLNAAHTELRETQQKLVAAEKFREAKNIAGGFAHEMRNALFPARGVLSHLARMSSQGESVSAEKLVSHTKLADRSIARAIDLTGLITRYTKIDSEYAPEQVSIDAVIKDVVSENTIRINETGAEVKTVGDSKTEVISNRKQLYSVFNNLLLNSLDAVTESSEKVVDIQWSQSEDSTVSLLWRDSGCGIPKENLDRVFESFFSTKPDKGTGIGLATVRKIVELYNGKIEAFSDGHQGAEFRITMKTELDTQ